MSKKKKLFLSATTILLLVLGLLVSVLYLQANPAGDVAQYLQRHGVPVEAIITQPQLSAASHKLGDLVPGIQVNARGLGGTNGFVANPAAFEAVSVKGVIGTSAKQTALINAESQTLAVRVGDQFAIKTARGPVTLRCEDIRTDLVTLSILNSDLRKDYLLPGPAR
jgi:hypothetical protein